MTSQAIFLDSDFMKQIREESGLSDDQPIRAVVYTRVSTEMQPQSALESQEAIAREFAEQNGIDVFEVFSDRGISGTTDKRPEFQKMIKHAKNEDNHIQIIIVYKLDRFFRNEQLHHVYEYELGKCGVFVLSATEETYRLDVGTRMFKTFTLIHNENEAIKIRQNVQRGQSYTAKQGKTNGGIPPLGYDINADGKYIINEDEAEIIKKIFTMRKEGLTYEQMAQKLNKKHYKTKVGREFTKNSFYEILTNPKYKGKFTYNRSVAASEYGKRPNRHKHKDKSEIIELDGQIEAIVSEELWNSVQPKKKTVTNRNKGKYLLSGLVKCPVCGEGYQADTKRGKKYFRHGKRTRDGCTTFIQMDRVEKIVVNKVVNKIYSSSNIDYFLSNFNRIVQSQSEKSDDEIKTLKRRITALKTKRDNYVESLSKITDADTIAEIETKIKDKRKQIEDLSEELKNLKKEIPQKPSREEVIKSKAKLKKIMLNLGNQTEARKLLQNMVECIYTKDNDVKVMFR